MLSSMATKLCFEKSSGAICTRSEIFVWSVHRVSPDMRPTEGGPWWRGKAVLTRMNISRAIELQALVQRFYIFSY